MQVCAEALHLFVRSLWLCTSFLHCRWWSAGYPCQRSCVVDDASSTQLYHAARSKRRDERHAHLIMCIYSEINFYFTQKHKKKTDAKRKSFMSLAALHWQLAKVKQKREKRERRMEKKKEKTKMTHAHKSCAEKCSQMLPFVTRESPHPPLTTIVASPIPLWARQGEASLIAPWGSPRKPLIKMRFLSPSPPAVPPVTPAASRLRACFIILAVRSSIWNLFSNF